MNKSYIIAPIILAAVFMGYYNLARKEMREKEITQQAAADKRKAEDDARKAEIDRKATLDAEKRQQERVEADRARDAKRVRDYEEAMKKLTDEANDYAAQVAKLTKESADLDQQATQTRNNREQLNREALEFSKEVELAKISRRNSELEIQRTVEMVGKRLTDSSLTTLPPPPPALPTGK